MAFFESNDAKGTKSIYSARLGGIFIENLEYWIWISRIKNITYEALELLIQKYDNIKNIWNLDKTELLKNKFLSKQQISDMTDSTYRKNLEKYAKYMEKNKIEIVNYKDSRYPTKLKYITNKPIVLYMKGDISNLNNESAAIVGSRNCSLYGKKNASFFSYELAKRNVNIVSGLAKGIDAVAHFNAIKAKGKTIAVIGNGMDDIYPKENLKLAEKILENDGLIISEYIIGTKPEKQNFPKRNRIISGISDAVIVVEASKKSGALITANYGIEQGKEIWAIPGNINSYTSIGTNNLIKDGANVLTNIGDIIRDI